MEMPELLANWKQFGAFGVLVIVLAKLGDKIFVWALDALGVNIKRGQTREDILIADVAIIRKDLDTLNRRFIKIEAAYDVVHDIAHKAADGIERELQKQHLDLPTINFFVDQLRSIEAIEELLREL